MFGKKKEEYTQDYGQMSEVQLASRFPEIANIKIANEDLKRKNREYEAANATLQEELAKYKALYESSQKTPANTSSKSAYIDSKIWEENKRLTKEVKELKEKIASGNGNTAPETNLMAKVAELEKDLNHANDRADALSNALNEERAENENLKEKLKNGEKKMGNEVTQWEYRILRTHGESEANIDELNKLGKDGWEVAGIEAPSAPLERYVLKRPKQKEEDYGYSR